MRPELILTVVQWVIAAALVVVMLILLWQGLTILRRMGAQLREVQARAAAAGVPQSRASSRWKWLGWGPFAIGLLCFGLAAFDPAHSVLYRRGWVIFIFMLVTVIVGAYAIWSPRQIRVMERGFSARDGVRYHAGAGRLVRYALLQGTVALYVLAVLAGWYVLLASRLFDPHVAAPVGMAAALAAIVALCYSLRRAHGLDRRLRRWVYGQDIPYELWCSVRLDITLEWMAIGAIAVFVAELPSFALSVH